MRDSSRAGHRGVAGRAPITSPEVEGLLIRSEILRLLFSWSCAPVTVESPGGPDHKSFNFSPDQKSFNFSFHGPARRSPWSRRAGRRRSRWHTGPQRNRWRRRLAQLHVNRPRALPRLGCPSVRRRPARHHPIGVRPFPGPCPRSPPPLGFGRRVPRPAPPTLPHTLPPTSLFAPASLPAQISLSAHLLPRPHTPLADHLPL